MVAGGSWGDEDCKTHLLTVDTSLDEGRRRHREVVLGRTLL